MGIAFVNAPRDVPQPGDYVYFRWENVENRVNVSHVGVVAVATQEYIITWEGNASKKVTQRTCFELFCQGCFHIFLQHAGVERSGELYSETYGCTPPVPSGIYTKSGSS